MIGKIRNSRLTLLEKNWLIEKSDLLTESGLSERETAKILQLPRSTLQNIKHTIQSDFHCKETIAFFDFRGMVSVSATPSNGDVFDLYCRFQHRTRAARTPAEGIAP